MTADSSSSSGGSTSGEIKPRRLPEFRKANKPLMEKRRRARINQSLSLLKRIVIDNNSMDGQNKPAKMEKADILEITVEFLQKNLNPVESHHSKFGDGYQECMRAVLKYFQNCSNSSNNTSIELLRFLRERLESSSLSKDFQSGNTKQNVPISIDIDLEQKEKENEEIARHPHLDYCDHSALLRRTIAENETHSNTTIPIPSEPQSREMEILSIENFESSPRISFDVRESKLSNIQCPRTHPKKRRYDWSSHQESHVNFIHITSQNPQPQPLDLCNYSRTFDDPNGVWRPW